MARNTCAQDIFSSIDFVEREEGRVEEREWREREKERKKHCHERDDQLPPTHAPTRAKDQTHNPVIVRCYNH